MSCIVFGQSDSDKKQQLVYTYLYSKDVDGAKQLITSEFIASEDPSRKITGDVYQVDYYNLIKNKSP